MNRRDLVKRLFGGVAAAAAPQEIVKKLPDLIPAPKFTDLANWKQVFEAMVDGRTTFFHGADPVALVMGKYSWSNENAELWDLATGTKKADLKTHLLEKSFPQAYELWKNSVANNYSIEAIKKDPLRRAIVIEKFGIRHVEAAERATETYATLFRRQSEIHSKLYEMRKSLRAGAPGFESELDIEGLDDFMFQGNSWHYKNFDPKKLEADVVNFEEYADRVSRIHEDPAFKARFKELEQLAKERKELEKKVRKMREDWRKKRDAISPSKTKTHAQERRIKAMTPKAIARRKKKEAADYERLMRPTGKELVLTPEWELGPEGPARFIRKVRDRF